MYQQFNLAPKLRGAPLYGISHDLRTTVIACINRTGDTFALTCIDQNRGPRIAFTQKLREFLTANDIPLGSRACIASHTIHGSINTARASSIEAPYPIAEFMQKIQEDSSLACDAVVEKTERVDDRINEHIRTVTAPMHEVEEIVEYVLMSGFFPECITIDALALYECMRFNLHLMHNERICIVHIGEKHTTIIVCHHNKIMRSKTLQIASLDHIVTSLSNHNSCLPSETWENIDDMLHEIGTQSSPRIMDIFIPHMQHFFRMNCKNLVEHAAGAKKMILCGPGAPMYLANAKHFEECGVEVQSGNNPLDRFITPAHKDDPEYRAMLERIAPRAVLAVGCALWGHDHVYASGETVTIP